MKAERYNEALESIVKSILDERGHMQRQLDRLSADTNQRYWQDKVNGIEWSEAYIKAANDAVEVLEKLRADVGTRS